MAPFSEVDKVLTKTLCEQNGYNAGQFVTKFPNKCCTKSGLLLKLRKYGRVASSSRQRNAGTHENADIVDLLVLSRDNMKVHVKLNMGIIF